MQQGYGLYCFSIKQNIYHIKYAWEYMPELNVAQYQLITSLPRHYDAPETCVCELASITIASRGERCAKK